MNARFCLPLLFVSLASGAGVVAARQQPNPPQIVSVTFSGPNTVTHSTGAHGLNASVGAWSGSAPSSEPEGTTTLRIVVDVNDGGHLVGWHWLQTFDTTEYDWANIYLDAPTGRISIAQRAGGRPPWEPPCCTYRATPSVAIRRSLNRWRNQQVTLVVELVNDGFGDQTQMNLVNLEFSACGIPWPAELTDPEALEFENGNTLRLDLLNPAMQTALTCLQNAVRAEGGTFEMNSTTFTSAYRNPAYQAHLQEVWEGWQQVQRTGPECQALRDYLSAETMRHRLRNLRQRPATRGGPHTQGNAVDINLNSPGLTQARLIQLADGCNIDRPFEQTDPPHLVLRPPQ